MVNVYRPFYMHNLKQTTSLQKKGKMLAVYSIAVLPRQPELEAILGNSRCL